MINSENIGLRMPEAEDTFSAEDFVYNWQTIDDNISDLQSQTETLTASDDGAGTVTLTIKGAE